MCVYCYHIIINFCYKVSKIQEKDCKISDCSNIFFFFFENDCSNI